MTVNPAVAELVPDAQRWRRHLHAHPELLYDLDQHRGLRRRAAARIRLRRRRDRRRPHRRRRRHQGRARARRARRSACAPTWTRCRSSRRPACPTLEASRQDARLRPRRPYRDAARRGRISRRHAQLRRLGRGHLPARRRRRRGRQGDGRRRPDGALRHRGSLWHAQHAGTAGRRIRDHARARSDGRGRFLTIVVDGKGGHAACPTIDHRPVIVAGAQIVTALQTIVSRNVDPLESIVVSVDALHRRRRRQHHPGNRRARGHGAHASTGGCATSPSGAYARSSPESPRPSARAPHARLSTAAIRSRSITTTQTDSPPRSRAQVVGRQPANRRAAGHGRRGFRLHARGAPGRLHLIGNGDTADLHHPEYDFNDDAIPFGIAYFARLVETALAG